MRLTAIAIITGLVAMTMATPLPEPAAAAVAEPVALPEALPEPEAEPEPDWTENPSAVLYKRTSCDPASIACNVADARWCADYLYNLGGQACQVGSQWYTKMCSRGGCYVWGRAVNGPSSASSYCGDVGLGLRPIVDSCTSNNVVAGRNFANGNGYLLLWLRTGNPNG